MTISLKTSPTEPRDVKTYQLISRFAGLVAFGVGSLVLLGWLLGIVVLTSLIPDDAPMKPNTALCFVLAGLSLWQLRLPRIQTVKPKSLSYLLGKIAASMVALIGLITLGEHLLGLNLGLDQGWWQNRLNESQSAFPGRMTLATAFGFFLLGRVFKIQKV